MELKHAYDITVLCVTCFNFYISWMIFMKSDSMLLHTSFHTFYPYTICNNEMADVQISEVGTTTKPFNPRHWNYERCSEIRLDLNSFLKIVKGNATGVGK